MLGDTRVLPALFLDGSFVLFPSFLIRSASLTYVDSLWRARAFILIYPFAFGYGRFGGILAA